MDRITNLLKSFTVGKYIQKTQKTEIEEFCEDLDDIKYEKLKETLKDVIDSTKYTKKLNEKIEKLKSELQEDMTSKEKNKIIEDIIKEINDDNLEEELDGECDRYMSTEESSNAQEYETNYCSNVVEKLQKCLKVHNENYYRRQNCREIYGPRIKEYIATQDIHYVLIQEDILKL